MKSFAHFLEYPFIVNRVLFLVMATIPDLLYPGVESFVYPREFQDHFQKLYTYAFKKHIMLWIKL